MLPVGILRTFICVLLTVFSVPGYAAADHTFENEAIVRTVQLGGSLVHSTTTYAVKALERFASIYVFAISADEHAKIAVLNARIKGGEKLELQNYGFNEPSNAYLYVADLPKQLKKDEKISLELESVLTRAAYPWPASIAQADKQALKFDTDLFVLSPYSTSVQRTKIRTSNPNVLSYTEPKNVDAFTLDAPVTKSGATITYGPYNKIPASTNKDFISNSQQRLSVHFSHELPILEIPKMKRTAEISHWGANLNIEDKIYLHNAGPKLKGHFSRIEHQRQQYYSGAMGHVMKAFNIQLPPGIRDAYYYDLNGNVSTSRLRVAPSVPKGATPQQYSVLEMRPRYPLAGGWNYSFTLGFDSPLQDWTSYDAKEGRYTVGIPLMTHFPDTIIDHHEVNIVFPEGATDVEIHPLFPPKSMTQSTHTTFLDSIGRPIVTMQYDQLIETHLSVIYASYKVPLSAHFRKPLTVAAMFSSLFVVAGIVRRLDFRIHKKY